MERRSSWTWRILTTGVLAFALLVTLATTGSAVIVAKDRLGLSSGPEPSFFLKPTWLPPSFSASGGGWVRPSGGLRIGAASHESNALFTMSYYGYHNPEDKWLQLVAGPGAGRSNAATDRIDGRNVALTSYFKPGPYGGGTFTQATWTERGAIVSIVAEGITEAQLARFIAGLQERAVPKRA
jgi:hypothetical protein